MKNERGFSFVEMLVVMAFILIIMASVFSLVFHFTQVSETENAKVELQQESRFMFSSFASEIRSAGSVLTLSHSAGFLVTAPYFNGIFPLDNTVAANGEGGTPDGIILAISDPDAVTKLSATFNPSSGTTLTVDDTIVEEGDAWAAGDFGILIGPAVDPSDSTKPIGYYVFEVVRTTTDTIIIRDTPVYYSGLLTIVSNNLNYRDPEATKGNNVIYPVNSPVMRLTNFSIYILNQVADSKKSMAAGSRDIRQLIRINDTKGNADPIAQNLYTIISENIWDMQISYVSYPSFPDTSSANTVTYFNATSSDYATEYAALLNAIRMKYLKAINVTFVAITDEYAGSGSEDLNINGIMNEGAYSLPEGKYGFKLLQFSVLPKNYNICI